MSLNSASLSDLDPPQKLKHYKKVSVEFLEEFSNWLDHVVDRVNRVQEITVGIYELPSFIKEKMNKNVNDLIILQNEAQASAQVVAQLQLQRLAVLKEVARIKEEIKQNRRAEAAEIETIAEAILPELNEKWQKLKNSVNIREIENFQKEIQAVYEGLNLLQDAVSRKIAKISQRGVKSKLKKKGARNMKRRQMSTIEDADDEGSDDPQTPHCSKNKNINLTVKNEAPRAQSEGHTD